MTPSRATSLPNPPKSRTAEWSQWRREAEFTIGHRVAMLTAGHGSLLSSAPGAGSRSTGVGCAQTAASDPSITFCASGRSASLFIRSALKQPPIACPNPHPTRPSQSMSRLPRSVHICPNEPNKSLKTIKSVCKYPVIFGINEPRPGKIPGRSCWQSALPPDTHQVSHRSKTQGGIIAAIDCMSKTQQAVGTAADSRDIFDAALTALVARIERDRSILAAILCGSLSHDTVWAKSDIDLCW